MRRGSSLLLLNLAIGVVWAAMQPDARPANFLIGFVIGFVVLSLIDSAYGRQVFALIYFIWFLVWSIIKSSIQVAGIILSPHAKLNQGIIAIPLESKTDWEISALATSITLTPGTLSIDVGTDSAGRRVLYVHSLSMDDPEALRTDIKRSFEKRILRFTRRNSADA